MEIVRKPSINLMTALAKIGGLVALLNISKVLILWHEFRFTKKINAQLNSSEQMESPSSSLKTAEESSESLIIIDDDKKTEI